MKELAFGDVVVGREQAPWSVDGKYATTVNVLVEPPVVRDRAIEVTGRIQNTRSTSARICVASSKLHVGPPYDPRVRYTGPLRPAPAPPPPIVLDLPPESFVPLAGAWELADWTWDGSFTVELSWSISLVPGPHISARFQITLPERPPS